MQRCLERVCEDLGLEPEAHAYTTLLGELELEGDEAALHSVRLRAQSAGWSELEGDRHPGEAARAAHDLHERRKDRLLALLALRRRHGHVHALSLATNLIKTLSQNGVLDVELLRIILRECASSSEIRKLLPFAEKAGTECISAADEAFVRQLVFEGISVADAHLQRIEMKAAPTIAAAPVADYPPAFFDEDTSLFRERLSRLLSCAALGGPANAHAGQGHLILAEMPSFATAIGDESAQLRAILPRLLHSAAPAVVQSAIELVDGMLAARLTGSGMQMELQVQRAQRCGVKPGLRTYARLLRHLRLEGNEATFNRMVVTLAETPIGSDPAIAAIVSQKEAELELLRTMHISSILSAKNEPNAFQRAAEFVATLMRNGVATESHVCDVLECFQGLSGRMDRLVFEFAERSAQPPGTRMLGILARQLQIDGNVERFNSVLSGLQREDTDHDALSAELIQADSLPEARSSMLVRLIALEKTQSVLAGAAHAQYQVMLASGVVQSKMLLVMMTSCVDSHSMKALMERTRRAVKPEIDHYNAVLRQLRVEADTTGTRQLLQFMKAELVLPNVETRKIFDLVPAELSQLRCEYLSKLVERSGFSAALAAFRQTLLTKTADHLVVRQMLELSLNTERMNSVLAEIKTNGLNVPAAAYAPFIRQLRIEGDQNALSELLTQIQPNGEPLQDAECIAAVAATDEEVVQLRWKHFATLPPAQARHLYAILINNGVARPENLAAALRGCETFGQMHTLLQQAKLKMGTPLDVPCFAILLQRAAYEGGIALQTANELRRELHA
jgi:hypothetical protein